MYIQTHSQTNMLEAQDEAQDMLAHIVEVESPTQGYLKDINHVIYFLLLLLLIICWIILIYWKLPSNWGSVFRRKGFTLIHIHIYISIHKYKDIYISVALSLTSLSIIIDYFSEFSPCLQIDLVVDDFFHHSFIDFVVVVYCWYLLLLL